MSVVNSTCNELEVCYSSGISRITKMRATYPYKFYQSNISDCVFTNVYLLGFGGGVVSGDSQELKITVKDNAILLMKTQGSTKIFKSVDDQFCSQKVVVHLYNGSLLAYLPDPTTCYKNSKYVQHQTYHLQETARYVQCEILLLVLLLLQQLYLMLQALLLFTVYYCYCYHE